MDDSGVTDRAVGADRGSEIIGEVDDTSILHICSFAYPDRINVSAEDSAVENTGVTAQSDIPDECGIGCHKSRLCYLGFRMEKPLEAIFGIHE
jgi:hypothetical protein